jgi:hypothetical protein
MQTTLYCTQTHLRIVRGVASGNKIKIKTAAEIPLPEDGISNGAIVDKNIMIGYFTDIINKYELDRSRTTFIIDSRSFTTREIHAPSLRRATVMDIITADFARDNLSLAGKVVDYAVTDNTRGEDGYSVLAAAIDKPVIESYLDVLLGAGFNLKHITADVNCRVKAERLESENNIYSDGDFDFAGYLLNIGAMLKPGAKGRDFEFLNLLEEFHGKPRGRSRFTFKTISISAAALILISFGAFYMIQTAQLQDDKTAISAYLNNADVKADYAAVSDAKSQIEHADKTTALLEGATKNLDGYPNLTSKQLEQITAIGKTQKTKVMSINFDKSNGAFTMNCVSESATYIPVFISGLRDCGLFTDVSYNGYKSDTVSSKKKKGARYEFTVEATVNAPAAPANENASAQGSNENV